MQNLAYFVRTHERALANALQLQRQHKHGSQQGAVGATAMASSSAAPTSISLAEALSRPTFTLSSQSIKPAKLALTPHHLFYLLSKFEDLGVDIGPMNVRLENLHGDGAPSNYVSFLGHAPKSRGKQSDADSLRSVSSVRSVMSSVSSIWSNFSLSNSAAKEEKRMVQHRDDIKYLYSCFTKIPALKLAPDQRARKVAGYEEFPFDTAVPLFAFKNLGVLEICDLDFRQFHGWDRLAEQVRSLTVRRAHLDDPIDLLQNIVLDDMERRRKRSSKFQAPTTPSTPGLPWPNNSPSRHIQDPSRYRMELARSFSTPNSPLVDQRRGSLGSPHSITLVRGGSADGAKTPIPQPSRQRSTSPGRPSSSKHGSWHKSRRSGVPANRRSSGSSGSSTHDMTPRHSTSDLLALGVLPLSKWRFLRQLSLAENGLTYLTADSLAPVAGTLQSLDLSGNLFTEIPDALTSLTHLRALNMSNCMINSLSSLARSPLPAITTLNLRSNRLLSLIGIEKVRTLERIDIRDNKLHDPAELARLTSALDLIDVYVVKNPFTRTHGAYRVDIFNLFRDTPGHHADITIDSQAATYNEKKLLHDQAAEPVPVPVVKPSPEDEERVHAVPGGEEGVADLDSPSLDPFRMPASYAHRRSTSDFGPQPVRRRKKAPRRRIVEISQHQDSLSSAPPMEPSVSVQQPSETPPPPTPTPTSTDEPTTPEPTLYHTAPTTQHATPAARLIPQRPTLDTSIASPTPAPRIHDPSDDDDDDDVQSPEGLDSHTDLYRQKIEALKTELGPNWLTALNEDRHYPVSYTHLTLPTIYSV